MPTIGPFYPSKGLSSEDNVFTAAPNSALTLTDFYLKHNTLVSRSSLLKLNATNFSTTHAIIGLTTWSDPAQVAGGTNVPIVVAVSNAKIWSAVLSSSMTFSDVTGTAPTIALTALGPFYTFASMGGKLIGAGNSVGGSAPFKISTYNGAAAPLGGTPPKGDIVYALNNYLFLGRDLSASGNYSKVYWSNVADPETWTAANYLEFRTNDGDVITALASIGNQLVIFKNSSIGILQTTSTVIAGAVTLGPLTTITDKVGCPGPMAVSKLPDGRLIFMTADFRIMIFDGANFICVSRQTAPGPSIYPELLNQYATLFAFFSVNTNISQDTTWFNFKTQATSLSEQLVYSSGDNTFTRQKLQDDIGSTIYPYVFTYIPCATNFTNIFPFMMMGDAQGNIWSVDSPALSGGPTNTTTTNDNVPIIEMSINLPEMDPPFIPRTILIPATLNGVVMTVTIGFNGTYEGSSLTKITSRSPLWNLYGIANKKTELGRPITMQIKLTFDNTGPTIIYPFYISDEVLA